MPLALLSLVFLLGFTSLADAQQRRNKASYAYEELLGCAHHLYSLHPDYLSETGKHILDRRGAYSLRPDFLLVKERGSNRFFIYTPYNFLSFRAKFDFFSVAYQPPDNLKDWGYFYIITDRKSQDKRLADRPAFIPGRRQKRPNFVEAERRFNDKGILVALPRVYAQYEDANEEFEELERSDILWDERTQQYQREPGFLLVQLLTASIHNLGNSLRHSLYSDVYSDKYALKGVDLVDLLPKYQHKYETIITACRSAARRSGAQALLEKIESQPSHLLLTHPDGDLYRPVQGGR